jgi:DNA-directed RNA polymerase specialized sigma24 family protein
MRLIGIHMNRHSGKTNEYATREYFCQVFQKDLDSLYQLAFLLTADHEKAQKIFVAGIDECASGNPVFKEWARSWARRVIIRSAIRLIEPVLGESEERYIEDDERETELAPGQAVAHLSPFKRFVFIMSVLERIPDRECAALLGCGTADIEDARKRAVQAIALSELRKHEPEKATVQVERRLEVV